MPTTSPLYAGKLLRVQTFKEATWGTPGIATARLMGIADYPQFKPFIKTTPFQEDRGSLQNTFYSSILKKGGEFTLNWVYASYEDILFALCNTLQLPTPSAGPPYTWTFTAPTSAVNTLQSLAMEFGYDILTGQYAGCIGNKLTIKGESEKQWEISETGFYKTYTPNLAVAITSSTNANPIEITTTLAHGLVTGDQCVVADHLINTAANGKWTVIRVTDYKATLTGSTGNGVGGATGTITKVSSPAIADRTVEAILFGTGTFAMDIAAAAPGTTPFTNVLLGFQLDIETKVAPIWTNDSLNPSIYGYSNLKPTLMLRLLSTPAVKQYVEGVLGNNGRGVIRIAEASGAKAAIIDFAGVLAEDPNHYGVHGSGAAYYEVKLEGQYDTGALANQLKIAITCAINALP